MQCSHAWWQARYESRVTSLPLGESGGILHQNCNFEAPKSACGATIITHSLVSYVSCCQSRVLRNKYHGFIIPLKKLSFSVSSWYSCDFLQETFQRTLIQLRETYHAGCGSFWICQNCRSTQYSSCEEMWSFHSTQDCNGASLKKTEFYKII